MEQDAPVIEVPGLDEFNSEISLNSKYNALVSKVEEQDKKIEALSSLVSVIDNGGAIKPNEEYGMLEQRVHVLEGLVKQLDDLILKNSGFVPPALVEAANSIEE